MLYFLVQNESYNLLSKVVIVVHWLTLNVVWLGPRWHDLTTPLINCAASCLLNLRCNQLPVK